MRSKKAIINIIVSLLLQVVTVICSFIVPKLIIKSFGSSVNGLTMSITQFLAYITLLESGFGSVVKSVLYKPIANKDKSEIQKILKASEKFFRIIAIIFIIYIVILSVILPQILSDQFDKLFTLSLIIIISISTFAEFYFGMTYKLFLQAEQKTYVVSTIQIGAIILNTIIIVMLVKIGANIQIVKLASSIIFIIRPILQNVYVKKKYNISLKGIDSNYDIKQKWDGFSQHVATVIHNNTDVVVLTLLLNTVEVSVYSVYHLIINGVKNLVKAFTGGVDASFGDMIAKDEKNALNKSFKVYELFYFTLITIVFSSTLLLILPFVSVYTKGITDADYYRPLFSYIIVLAEFIWTIRLPYSTLILAAGHFKQTMKGAWVEASTNIVLSVILVFKFGIVGVAIGTFVAMLIRTIEFMYHCSKHILQRSIKFTFKRVFVVILEVIVIIIINGVIPSIIITSYKTWAIQAIITTVISAIIVLTTNILVYNVDTKELINIIKRNMKRKKNENI